MIPAMRTLQNQCMERMRGTATRALLAQSLPSLLTFSQMAFVIDCI